MDVYFYTSSSDSPVPNWRKSLQHELEQVNSAPDFSGYPLCSLRPAQHYRRRHTCRSVASPINYNDLELVNHNYHLLKVMGISHPTIEAATTFLFEHTETAATKRLQTNNSHTSAAIHQSSKRRRLTSRYNAALSTDQTGSLPPTLHPNLQGIITITPPLIWRSLHPEHRNWVLRYNAAVRHDEKPPLPPDGTTVSYYKDDGNGNKDIPGKRS